jgi:hypothetical protein
MKKVLITAGLIALFFAACYYDNEEFLYPVIDNSCDTANVTFAGTISILLSNNCLSCHSNSTAASFGNNIRLENYADVVSQNQRILGAIRHDQGYFPMPQGGAKLNDCLITQFSIWVNKGSPNN